MPQNEEEICEGRLKLFYSGSVCGAKNSIGRCLRLSNGPINEPGSKPIVSAGNPLDRVYSAVRGLVSVLEAGAAKFKTVCSCRHKPVVRAMFGEFQNDQERICSSGYFAKN